MQFDEKILGAEFLRAGHPNLVESKQPRCTMQAATNYCRLLDPYAYKWPTVQGVAHEALFTDAFDGAHRALADVRAFARCYVELKRRKIVA